jgi:hypothetical protein
MTEPQLDAAKSDNKKASTPSAKKQVIAELALRVIALEENLLALAEIELSHKQLSAEIEDLRARLSFGGWARPRC